MAFGYYSSVTINPGQVPSTQTDFPVLISLTDARLKTVANGGHVIHSGGFDIRPYSDAGITTPITGYELVFYDGVNGIIEMWVKRSSVSNGLITYLAYNDASINADGSSTSTWSNSFIDVYHLKDGTTLSVASSTGTHNATNHAGVTATTGQIDGAGGFASASSQYIDTVTYAGPTAVTISCWLKATSFPTAYTAPIGKNSAGQQVWIILIKSTGKLAVFVNATGSVSYDGTGSHTLLTATWYYLTATYSSSTGLIGYVNAASDQTAAANGALNTVTAPLVIGNDLGAAGRFWNGAIDEARVSSVARSADWITTEYNNQNAPATFQTLGAEVNLTSFGGLFTK